MAFFESVGGVREDFNPSAGGGPGTGLTASKFATGARDMGSFRLGASTTFSRGAFPRATRRVWVRWYAS